MGISAGITREEEDDVSRTTRNGRAGDDRGHVP